MNFASFAKPLLSALIGGKSHMLRVLLGLLDRHIIDKSLNARKFLDNVR